MVILYWNTTISREVSGWLTAGPWWRRRRRSSGLPSSLRGRNPGTWSSGSPVAASATPIWASFMEASERTTRFRSRWGTRSAGESSPPAPAPSAGSAKASSSQPFCPAANATSARAAEGRSAGIRRCRATTSTAGSRVISRSRLVVCARSTSRDSPQSGCRSPTSASSPMRSRRHIRRLGARGSARTAWRSSSASAVSAATPRRSPLHWARRSWQSTSTQRSSRR